MVPIISDWVLTVQRKEVISLGSIKMETKKNMKKAARASLEWKINRGVREGEAELKAT